MSRDRRPAVRLLLTLGALVVLVACGPAAEQGAPSSGASPQPTAGDPTTPAPPAEALRLYTSVTQDTVDAVVGAFDGDVEVFRAPTGELNARIAAERREGDLRADVLWLTDPLSMWPFAEEGLLHDFTPDGADAVPAAHRGEGFWGTRLLHVVIVAADDLEPVPTTWWDLAEVEGGVAVPDPGFAGSAFAALGAFALDEDYGFDFYRALTEADVIQVQAPGEVVAGVAEGRVAAGVTLDREARDAVEAGSPVQLVWPEDGAIAVASPIAVVAGSDALGRAEAFVEHVLSRRGQELIAETGWQPIDPEVAWPHEQGSTIEPDWAAAFARRDELIAEYRAIVGG